MKRDDLEKLRIPREQRSSRGSHAILIFLAIAFILVAAAWFAWPRVSDSKRLVSQTQPQQTDAAAPCPVSSPALAVQNGSYYGFSGQNGHVGVPVFASVPPGRRTAAVGRAGPAPAALQIGRTRFNRLRKLREQRVESEQQLDDAQAELTAAEAGLREAQGLLDFARWQLAWTVIRSPIDGVVLEKLADENELVSPQSFGGDKGPSTALLAVADPQDLQVEIDLNESDLSKVWLDQPCRVTPEAYPDHVYNGYVAEIAPEANRQKGTLQIKVQVKDPDRYLVPELSAKVDFLASYPPVSP